MQNRARVAVFSNRSERQWDFRGQLHKRTHVMCGFLALIITLLMGSGCTDEAVGVGGLACVPDDPPKCDQTLTKVLRCSGSANAWIVDKLCLATERCEDAECQPDPGNPFIGGGNDTSNESGDTGADGIGEFLAPDSE